MKSRLSRIVLCVTPFLIAMIAAASSDVSAFQTVRYALWCLGWWAIGTALTAFLPWLPQGRFVTATYGGVIGLVAQLAAWALFVGAGIGSALPFAVIVAFLGVFAIRRPRNQLLAVCALRGGNSLPEDFGRPTTAAIGAWAMGSGVLSVVAASFFHSQTLPPKASSMYQDLYWHLGIAANLKQHVLPNVVESDTGRLNYHWLSDAFMAAGSLGAHVPTMYVAERLWLLPLILLSPALFVVVSRQVSGSWRGSWVSVLITTVGASLPIFPWQSLGPSATYLFLSPSQVFGVPMTLFAISLMVQSFRAGHLSIRAFGVMVVVDFLCAGSKSSIIPVLLGGTACVLFTHMVARTPQRRARRKVALGLLTAQILALAAAMPLFAGGSAGSKIRLFGHLRHWNVITEVTHHPHAFDHGPFIPPGLSATAVVVFVAVVAAILLSYGLGAFAFLLGSRTWREDATPTLLLGAFLASVAAFLLIDHTGQSESYFPMGAMPLLSLLAAWGWTRIWEAQQKPRVAQLWAGLLAGGLCGLAFRELLPHRFPSTVRHGVSAPTLMLWLGLPLLLCALVILGLSVAARRGTPLVLPLAALLGLSVLNPAWSLVASTANGLSKNPHMTRATVRPPESAAAQWVRNHTPNSAMVATNVHCLSVTRINDCMSSAYWTSGLMERQMFVGSWGYTDGAQKNAGVDGLPAVNQAYPDATAFRLNESMFYAPTASAARKLRAKGVQYLYADQRVAPLSPHITQFAQPVHRNGPVTIYKLK